MVSPRPWTKSILRFSLSSRQDRRLKINLWITGGNDVFVDIGDKSWGVRSCQKYFGGIEGGKTLHVGDQFLSAGANDFKVRLNKLVREEK